MAYHHSVGSKRNLKKIHRARKFHGKKYDRKKWWVSWMTILNPPSSVSFVYCTSLGSTVVQGPTAPLLVAQSNSYSFKYKCREAYDQLESYQSLVFNVGAFTESPSTVRTPEYITAYYRRYRIEPFQYFSGMNYLSTLWSSSNRKLMTFSWQLGNSVSANLHLLIPG